MHIAAFRAETPTAVTFPGAKSRYIYLKSLFPPAAQLLALVSAGQRQAGGRAGQLAQFVQADTSFLARVIQIASTLLSDGCLAAGRTDGDFPFHLLH